MRGVVAILGGGLFGAGLGLSGCANPVVINNFLDLASPDLDLTLIVLFATALTVSTLAYQAIFRLRQRPVLDEKFHLPTRTDIDAKLIGGSLLFGFGWSLSGFCPGPALSASAAAWELALPYLAAVAIGSLLHDFVFRGGKAKRGDLESTGDEGGGGGP